MSIAKAEEDEGNCPACSADWAQQKMCGEFSKEMETQQLITTDYFRKLCKKNRTK